MQYTSLREYIPKYIKTTSNRNKITCGCETCISAMLLQLDLNKWRLSQLTKLDKLYINSASTRLLQISNNYFIEYNNQVFPNNSHIYLKSCDAMSSYNFPSPITGSNISKWDCILNCCSDCPRINAPYLESSEQLDRLFPTSLHKIKFHLFQNIYKCSIHGLRPFKYKNTCDLCDNMLDKDDRGIIMTNFFVLHEEVIDVFHEKKFPQ